MMGFIIFIHAILCVGLVIIILMQSGRGGGLTEAFSGAESLFGAQTNTLLTKTTTVFAVLFFVTCIGLAIFSVKKNESLMTQKALLPAAATQTDNSTKPLEQSMGQIEEQIQKLQAEADKSVETAPTAVETKLPEVDPVTVPQGQ